MQQHHHQGEEGNKPKGRKTQLKREPRTHLHDNRHEGELPELVGQVVRVHHVLHRLSFIRSHRTNHTSSAHAHVKKKNSHPRKMPTTGAAMPLFSALFSAHQGPKVKRHTHKNSKTIKSRNPRFSYTCSTANIAKRTKKFIKFRCFFLLYRIHITSLYGIPSVLSPRSPVRL